MQKNLEIILQTKADARCRAVAGSSFLIFLNLVLCLGGFEAKAQELIVNGTFSGGTNGLNDWTQASWAGGSSFGVSANGPTDTSAASGSYAYAGGGALNLLQQDVAVTTGKAYRLTFLAGSKSGAGPTVGKLSLRQELLNNYSSASFDYRPSADAFGSYTLDFVPETSTVGIWLRNDGGGYAAYDNVSVTEIGSVTNALSYSSASGYSEITSTLSGSGKVTVNAGSGGLTLSGANTHTGGTEVKGGTLYVTGSGTLGNAGGAVTANGGILDLRNQQTRTGTISITNTGFILSGDGTGSLVNNGGAFQFSGGSLEVPLSGSGGLIVTGGGRITSSNSYSGSTTISNTLGWFDTHTFFLVNSNALGLASGDLTIAGGAVDLQTNTITRSGNLTISGGTINSGVISKSGSDYVVQGGVINAGLAGTAGLTKSGAGNAAVYGSNTYSGDTVINQGTLVVGSAGSLGNAAAAVTVNSGGALYLGGGLTFERTGNLTLNGGKVISVDTNLATIRLSGGGNFIASAGTNAAEFAVKLSGTNGLSVGGTGDTWLWAPNSYTGPTVVNSGRLLLGGTGAIAESSAVQIASGAAFVLTGDLAPNNINRTIAGLTGGGVLWGGGGTVTVNKASGTDSFSGDIQGDQGLIKSGAGTLALGGASSYTGATTVSAGTLLIANGSALGSTAAGTTVASGAQLRLHATNSGFMIGNELLTISGQGVTTGGALRNAAGNNTLQGKVNLAADATIGAQSGTSLTLDVASGNAIEASNFNLTFDGAGTNVVKDPISLGAGGLTKIGTGRAILGANNSYSGTTTVTEGSLVISNNIFAATIQSNSLAVNFASAPTAGTYSILPGSLASASLGSTTVTVAGEPLPAGLTATVANSSNLAVVVQSAPTQTPLETYLASFGLTDAAALLGTADPDGDGMDNSTEFAFGTNPNSGASRAVTLATGTTEIKVSYLQRKSGVSYTVRSLPNLTTPFDSGAPVTPSISPDQANLPSPDYERYEATLSTGPGRGFLRVKAVQ